MHARLVARLLLPLGAATWACAPRLHAPAPPPQPASAELAEPTLIDPVIDLTDDDDFVVRVVAGGTTCSGTLITRDQVLTAHHCVSQRNSKGETLAADVEPDAITVELGGGSLQWGDVKVRAIVAPPCGHATGVGDIAVLVLDRRLGVQIATLPPRLDRPPKIGDTIEPIGFGLCVASETGVRRKARAGGKLDALRASRFRLDASICPGDSGGPALNDEGELVGVISASVMDGSEDTLGRSEFTRVDHWRPVFSNAKLIAEGASPAEVPPISGCAD